MTMTTKLIICTFFIALIHLNVNSQAIFIKQGKIEFEKKENLHKIIEGEGWLENFKDKIPQYRTTYFNLYFKDNKTVFEKARDSEEKIPFF